MLMAMGTWEWVGVVALGWCLISCVAAVILGRAIQASARAVSGPKAVRRVHPNEHSGFIVLNDRRHASNRDDTPTGTTGTAG